MLDFVKDTEQQGGAAEHERPTFRYPYASAPDIIRANQKDAYFQTLLLQQLSSIIRSLYGVRVAHKYTPEVHTFTEMLYLGLTTFVGNRTLGEEYCDIVQLEDETHKLPSIVRRSGYILATVLLPYALSRVLPAFRRKLRARLEASSRKSSRGPASSPTSNREPQNRRDTVTKYILTHLDTMTSPAPIYALSLATFYFSGAYYQLSKRLFRLRYIFTRKLEPSEQRVGYEVLGILLVLQMGVQGYLHMRDTYQSGQSHAALLEANTASVAGASAVIGGGVEIGMEPTIAAPLLFEAPPSNDAASQNARIQAFTHTAAASTPRHDLGDPEVMQCIDGKQARKCTLCLEPMKDPSVTTCGHVFCWTCIGDWLREQPLCPLCRQSALVQHVLPLRC